MSVLGPWLQILLSLLDYDDYNWKLSRESVRLALAWHCKAEADAWNERKMTTPDANLALSNSLLLHIVLCTVQGCKYYRTCFSSTASAHIWKCQRMLYLFLLINSVHLNFWDKMYAIYVVHRQLMGHFGCKVSWEWT